MRLPVIPFLASLILLEGAAFATFAYRGAWPVGILTTLNFIYSGYREFFHNGRPATLWRRK